MNPDERYTASPLRCIGRLRSWCPAVRFVSKQMGIAAEATATMRRSQSA
jgi:hypothetical protein